MEYQRCSRGLWDTTVPGITFDENGVSNYSKMFDKLCKMYPRGEKGASEWNNIVERIKKIGLGKPYDCIIGVSGGTDSSFLLYLAKEIYGLRPLAVNLDNGWSSDIAVKNIRKITRELQIDLETYVIEYEEVKDLLRAYMRAGLPWIDIPTDLAIKSVLFKIAKKEGIKFILRGNDFRSEGFQPREWTYGDGRQLNYIHNQFGKTKLNTYPNYTIVDLAINALLTKTKSYFPFYYLEYSKQDAQKYLIERFGWEYYGGHHHENIFTKFAISYWLFEKFGIDKRKITLSAQVMSGKVSYSEAKQELEKLPYHKETIIEDIKYVLKKLDMTVDEFDCLMKAPNKYFTDYPSYFPMLTKFSRSAGWVLNKIYPYKPMSILQMEMRDYLK